MDDDDSMDTIMKLPEFDLKNFPILDLECKVFRKYYVELTSVLFVNNISKYFLSEFIVDHKEFNKVSDPFSHKDKSTTFLNIVHHKMKAGNTEIFRTMLDTLHFYGDKALRAVVDKMKRKLFEMKVNKRGEIEQRRNSRIAGRPERYYGQDDYPVNDIPNFSEYRVILRCLLKIKSTMTAIYKRTDIHKVREACIKNARTPNGPWLSKHFINAISLVETAEELFEVLMHTHHLDWINFTILEALVKHTRLRVAQEVLDAYKKYTLPLTFLTVVTINSRVPKIEDPGPEYTRVKEILAMDVSKLTVGKLLEHKTFLEKNVFDINEGSTRVGSVDWHGSEVVWIIPMECSFHAYRYANNNMHKFDMIISLEIEDYPIIKKKPEEFSTDPPLSIEASSVELVDQYGTVLLEQLNATSLVPTMLDRCLLNEEDVHVIKLAASEYQKNSYILGRVQGMDNCGLLRFCDILQGLDHQQHLGMALINDLFYAERKESKSSLPTDDQVIPVDKEVVSKSEVTLGKRPASHGESPCTKRSKLLAVFRKFTSVVQEIGESMESVKLKHLYLWLAFQEASKDPKIRLFPPEPLTGLDECDNAVVFLNKLSFQWSWIDHSLLEDLLKANHCEEGTKILKRYKSELSQIRFLSSSILPSPCPKMLPIDEQLYTILTLTVECKLFECSLQYVSELKSSFTASCGILRHSLQLAAVKQTSITSTIFYWMVSRQLVPLICSKVQANRKELRSSGILEVSVYPNIIMATDGEVRFGSLAFLTISGGTLDDSVKTLMSRTKELPEVVAKLQCELDQCRSQLQKDEVEETEDVALTKLSELCDGKGLEQLMEVTEAEQEKEPTDNSVDMTTVTSDANGDANGDVNGDVNGDANGNANGDANGDATHESKGQLQLRAKNEAENTHLLDMWLKKKLHYCLQLEKHVSKGCLGQIFCSSWELREAGLKQLTQDIMFLLMPAFPCRIRNRSRNWKLSRSSDVSEILESSCAVLAYSCTDKVLRVYQAALRLCWVIVYNAVCTTERELDELKEFFKPVLSVIFSRYDDRELSIRQSTKMFLMQFFHGQTGALFTINHPFGDFRISGVFFICSCLLTIPVHRKVSDYWWIVRLNFISDTFSRFGDYYFPQDNLPTHDYYGGRISHSDYREPEMPVNDEEILAVLTLVWKFVSTATNSGHRYIVNTAVQIYSNTLQLVARYNRGLDRAKEFLVRCHQSVVDELRDTIKGYQGRLDNLIDGGYEEKDDYPKIDAIAYSNISKLFKTSADEKEYEEDPYVRLWDGKELDKDKVLALDNYRAMMDVMYPPIFVPTPVDNMLAYLQGFKASNVVYREGLEWIKGRIVNDINNLYCAQDVRTGTIMAVCQAPLSSPRPSLKKEKLLKEVSLTVGLHHHNVVRYIGATIEDDIFNIFQEWTAGGSLRQLLGKCGGLHPSVVTAYTKQLVQGVAYLHANRIIHRNLCDFTVLVDHSGQKLKVSDLSYAVKIIANQPTERIEFSDNYNCYNVFFTAPEVVRRESYGMSCDAWSVGCCIVMMATGQSPWAFEKSHDPYIDAIRVAKATSSPVVSSKLTGEIAKLVIRCLDIRPEDRLKLLESQSII